MTAQAARGTLAAMDNATGHRRIAQRFLISILQQYGPEAPAVLRDWADELEQVAREEGGELPRFDLDKPGSSAFSSNRSNTPMT